MTPCTLAAKLVTKKLFTKIVFWCNYFRKIKTITLQNKFLGLFLAKRGTPVAARFPKNLLVEIFV